MPLSDDQKAMLRLLAQREQGYDDLAALMGLSVDEVRAKVGDALAQLEKEGKESPPLPAEPAGVKEDPAPVAPAPSATPAPTVESAQPQPAREPQPAPSTDSEPEPAAATRERPERRPPPKLSMPGSRGARAAIAAGLAVLVLVVVVLAVSGGDGDSRGSATTAASEGAPADAANAAANSKEATQAILSAVDGGDAKGLAVFGRIKNSLALQIEASGLDPTGDGESYTIWLYQSSKKMLPLASTRVDKSGKIGAQVAVPAEVLAYLAQGTFDQIDVSLTGDAALKASLAKATSEKKAPIYTGTDVLRGPITGPIVEAAAE